MSEENRPPEDVQPFARPVHELRLARPVGGDQEEEVSQAEGEQQEASQVERAEDRPEEEQQEARQVEEVGEKGPISRVVDKGKRRAS